MNNISILGQNIHNLLNKKELSAYRLSQISGVSQTTISHLLSGKRKTVNFETIEKLSKALEVSTDSLLGIQNEVSYEVSDFKDSIEFILESNEVKYDNILLSNEEKKIILRHVLSALDEIKLYRDPNVKNIMSERLLDNLMSAQNQFDTVIRNLLETSKNLPSKSKK